MAITEVTCTENTWVKVLTNVTYTGQVVIKNQGGEVVEPTAYFVSFVPTGNPAPTTLIGAISFDDSFSPSNSIASDFYVYAKDSNGLVVVYT